MRRENNDEEDLKEISLNIIEELRRVDKKSINNWWKKERWQKKLCYNKQKGRWNRRDRKTKQKIKGGHGTCLLCKNLHICNVFVVQYTLYIQIKNVKLWWKL